MGALALVSAAVSCIQPPLVMLYSVSPLGQVERAYGMYATGDFIDAAEQFDADSWGPRTARYLDYIVNDLNERNWNSIFAALSSFTVRVEKEEAVQNGESEEPCERVPLPPSDPPSPRDD